MVQKRNNKLLATYIPIYLRGFFEYHIVDRFKTLPPRELMLVATYRCNARCVMCNIWKMRKDQLSVEQFAEVLSDPLFRKVQIVNVTGGEPTLRTDLDQIVRLLVEKLSRRRARAMTEAFEIERLLDALDAPDVFATLIDTGHLRDDGLDPASFLAAWRHPVDEIQLKDADSRPPSPDAPVAEWLAASRSRPAVVAVEHRRPIHPADLGPLIDHLRSQLGMSK